MTIPKLQFLDLSHWSWPVNFSLLKENPDLIAVGWKATQGHASHDNHYQEAKKAIQSLGLLFLAYHFGDHTDPAGQVENFVNFAQPDDNMRLALDWEDYKPSQMTAAQAEQFCQLCDQKTGRTITVYSGNTARDMLGHRKSAILGAHPLWIPSYTAHQPVLQASWEEWDVWQYAADGSGSHPNVAKGVNGHPDCNVFAKPVEIVRASWSGRAGTAEPKLPPGSDIRQGVVIVKTLNLREKASATSRIVGTLAIDTQLRVYGEVMNGDTKWLKVDNGYVAAKYVAVDM